MANKLRGGRAIDPLASSYFGTGDFGDSGSGSSPYGSGQGNGFYTWDGSGLDSSSFRNPGGGGGDSTVDPSIDARALSEYLRSNGYQMMENSTGQNGGYRWVQDAQGNVVGAPQQYSNSDNGFALGMLAAGGLAGGMAAGLGAGAVGGGGAAAGGGGAAGGGIGGWGGGALSAGEFGAGFGGGGAFAPSITGASGLTGAIGGGAGGAGMFGISNGQWLNTGLNLLGGFMGDRASGQAADAGLAAGREANALQKYMYDTTRKDYAPWRQAGVGALGQLQGLLKDPSTITDDPGYQLQLAEGINALENIASARGSQYSGQQAKALQRYGNDYAGTKLDQTYNRLAGLSGTGMTATGGIANAGQNYANQAGNNLTDMGNVRASGYVGGANAWGNALGNIGSDWQYSDMMQRYGRGG